ncbi:uncharacterized protein LOC143253363 isoform X2 [Tachypleus tridentatus]|uniref:uncharacterized protein LOC143253363 isoform X2 n=1 Tax=Tachypleus tridentatus TaxID=6853 RepID=UPI003FD5B26B
MQLRLECSIVLLYVLAGLLHGQITNKGSCAIFDSKHKFHFAQFYNGGWYIVEGYPNRFYEDSVCHEWSLATDGKYVYINETVFNVKKHDFESLQGKARYQSKGSVNCLLLSPGLKSRYAIRSGHVYYFNGLYQLWRGVRLQTSQRKKETGVHIHNIKNSHFRTATQGKSLNR